VAVEDLSKFLDKAAGIINKCAKVVNVKNIDFFIENCWADCFTPEMRSQLLENYDRLIDLPSGAIAGTLTCRKDETGECLHCFVEEIRATSLYHAQSNLVCDLKDFSLFCLASKMEQSLRLTKKDYEIDEMAGLCAGLAQQCGTDVLVDVGSGLGYLD